MSFAIVSAGRKCVYVRELSSLSTNKNVMQLMILLSSIWTSASLIVFNYSLFILRLVFVYPKIKLGKCL